MPAALQWCDPWLGRDGSAKLPATCQSLRGWEVLTPALTRLPLPEELVSAIARELVAIGPVRDGRVRYPVGGLLRAT